jgi:hypothetical protein
MLIRSVLMHSNADKGYLSNFTLSILKMINFRSADPSMLAQWENSSAIVRTSQAVCYHQFLNTPIVLLTMKVKVVDTVAPSNCVTPM